jgi:anti-sigma regulatory factor (Ser/Thr protein kinase)/anti-anti-sigma regulatory factor
MQQKDLHIEISDVPGSNGALIISFSGELSSLCISRISSTFDSINYSLKKFVIAEMTNVTMVSSAALGEFMGGRKRLLEAGGDLVFTGLQIDLRSKLNMMGANKIFRFYNDTRSAINAYKWEYEKHHEHLHLSFPPFLKLVPPIRSLVSRIAKQKGYSNRDSFRIETIIDEVCNNAIEHGLKGANKSIDLKITINPAQIEFTVTSVSDPEKMQALRAMLKYDEHDLSKWRTDERRGRGLALIKMLSNELTVDCNESGTSVHVKKLREE